MAEAAMRRTAEVLGGREVLGRSLRSHIDVVAVIRAGMNFEALERVMKFLSLSLEEASDALRIPLRTLARRKLARKLDPAESERVIRLAKAAQHASEVLGSAEKARRWLLAPNRALDGAAPITLLDTDVGAGAVDDVLVRIDHGVFS